MFYDALSDRVSDRAPHPQPTWYSAVPTMHDKILQFGEALVKSRTGLDGVSVGLTHQDHKLSFIRNCSAALLPPISERLIALFNCTVLPTYAMTGVWGGFDDRYVGMCVCVGEGCDDRCVGGGF